MKPGDARLEHALVDAERHAPARCPACLTAASSSMIAASAFGPEQAVAEQLEPRGDRAGDDRRADDQPVALDEPLPQPPGVVGLGRVGAAGQPQLVEPDQLDRRRPRASAARSAAFSRISALPRGWPQPSPRSRLPVMDIVYAVCYSVCNRDRGLQRQHRPATGRGVRRRARRLERHARPPACADRPAASRRRTWPRHRVRARAGPRRSPSAAAVTRCPVTASATTAS